MLRAGTDTLLDCTAYRRLAAYALGLAPLRRGTERAPTLKLNSRRDAAWLAARLKHRCGAVTATAPPGEHAVWMIRNDA